MQDVLKTEWFMLGSLHLYHRALFNVYSSVIKTIINSVYMSQLVQHHKQCCESFEGCFCETSM